MSNGDHVHLEFLLRDWNLESRTLYMSQQIPQSYGTSLDILGCEKVLCKEMMNQQQLAVMLEEHGCNGKGDEVRWWLSSAM